MRIEPQNRMMEEQNTGSATNDSIFELDARKVAGEKDLAALRAASEVKCLTGGIMISVIITC